MNVYEKFVDGVILDTFHALQVQGEPRTLEHVTMRATAALFPELQTAAETGDEQSMIALAYRHCEILARAEVLFGKESN